MSGSTRFVGVGWLHEIDKPTCIDDFSRAGHAFSQSCARLLIEKLPKGAGGHRRFRESEEGSM